MVPQIRARVRATEPPTFLSAIQKAGALINEAVRSGILSKTSEKRKEETETSKKGGTVGENKKMRNGKGFAATTPTQPAGYLGPAHMATSGGGRAYVGNLPRCAKCNRFHPENVECHACFKCGKVGHVARSCRSGITQVITSN